MDRNSTVDAVVAAHQLYCVKKKKKTKNKLKLTEQSTERVQPLLHLQALPDWNLRKDNEWDHFSTDH